SVIARTSITWPGSKSRERAWVISPATMCHHPGRSYLGLRDSAGKHLLAVPTLSVGVDPQVDLAVVRDRLGPETINVFPPEKRHLGSPSQRPPGRNHPDEEGSPSQLPRDQVDQGVGFT